MRKGSWHSLLTLRLGALPFASSGAYLSRRSIKARTLCTCFRELNQVIELWRFKDATACIAHREASRALPEWRAAIGKVAPMVQVRKLSATAFSRLTYRTVHLLAELLHVFLAACTWQSVAVVASGAAGQRQRCHFPPGT
jgi:NIPSNAP